MKNKFAQREYFIIILSLQDLLISTINYLLQLFYTTNVIIINNGINK